MILKERTSWAVVSIGRGPSCPYTSPNTKRKNPNFSKNKKKL
jgi:hypothetical protein